MGFQRNSKTVRKWILILKQIQLLNDLEKQH